MAVHSVHWSWLGDLDRKYPKLPQIPSSGSPERPSSTSLPGSQPLPPSMHSARELFIVGRTFKLLLDGRLTVQWKVVRQTAKSCRFITTEYPEMVCRGLPWRVMEDHILENRVRWMNSISTIQARRSRSRPRTPR